MTARVVVTADADAFAAAASSAVVDAAAAAIDARGAFHLVLAGGSTPLPAYRRLAAPPLAAAIDWPRVHAWFGDERCVPADHPRSNLRAIRAALLDHVPIPAAQVHAFDGAAPPAEAATAMEGGLDAVFGPGGAAFDLVLLGLGDDGHVASLFPGGAALAETSRRCLAVTDGPAPEPRVTLTLPALSATRAVRFLVAGAAKRGALRAALCEPVDPGRRPSQGVQPATGDVAWLVDRAADGSAAVTS